MKKLLTITLAMSFVLAMLGANAMAKKVGEIKNNVYTDKDYKFSINTFDGWSAKIGSKSKVPLRLTMMEKSYPVPQAFQGGNEDYAQIPTIKVLVDTCSSSVDDFIKQLNDHKFKSPQKKFFLKHLKIIAKRHEVLTKSDVTIQGTKAIVLNVRQPYTLEVSRRGSDRASVVDDYKTGSLLFTVRDGKIYVVYFICEYRTSAGYKDKWNSLLKSLTFDVK